LRHSMQNFSTIALFGNQTAIPMTAFAFLCWKAQRARAPSFATDFSLPPLGGGKQTGSESSDHHTPHST
jgi:hypothetical protein